MQEPEDDLLLYGQYIRRIALHVMRRQDDLLAPHNITSQQARALVMIRHLRAEERGCCQKHLESAFGVRGSSVTSLLKGLEKRGFINRVSGKDDARTKQLHLTEKGEALVDTFLQILRETEHKMMQGMSNRERETLLDLLQRAMENVD